MEIDDIEDVYDLKLQAQQVQPFLCESAYRFENYVDNFNHTEQYECSTKGHYVSESMLAYEATHFVDVIETHEALLDDLREAVDILPSCHSHRYINGERVRKESLEEDLTDLINDYREDFDEVIRICGKTAAENNLPGPQKVRSKRNQRKAQREAVNRRTNTAAFQNFFAD